MENETEVPLYKSDLLKNHKVRVFYPHRKKPGHIIIFNKTKYQVQPDGSLRKINA